MFACSPSCLASPIPPYQNSSLSNEEREQLEEETERSRQLDEIIRLERTNQKPVLKLLLLGASESGKSTIFKQVNNIYGLKPTMQQKKAMISIIHANILQSLQTLCEQSLLLKIQPENDTNKDFLQRFLHDIQISNSCNNSSDGKEIFRWDHTFANQVQSFWLDKGIQAVFEQRSKYHIGDSTPYFLNDQIHKIVQDGYIPSDQDIIRTRVKTTSIVESEFVLANNHFKILDVGGQRSERRKWIQCFGDVMAVIFVAAISQYDQIDEEDHKTNRLDLALDLFDKICNNLILKNTAMILFLNKKDLFASKIKTKPLSSVFSDYDGDPYSFDDGIQYMQSKFEQKNRSITSRQIFTHVTCATDTENIEHVFQDVKDIVIQQALKRADLC